MGVMDLRAKKSWSEDMMSESNKKFCTDCKTTKTPSLERWPCWPQVTVQCMWNQIQEKRRAMLGLNKGIEKKKEISHSPSSDSSSSIAPTNDDGGENLSANLNGLSESVKMRLFALGSEVLLQTSSSLSGVVKKQRCQRRRKLGEEEQAAISLMALSCGTVFA